MSSKQSSTAKQRFGECKQCLICGGNTIYAFRKLDMCRACAVFYRRSADKRNFYECRTGEDNCAINQGSTCRKCRLGRIEKLIENSRELDDSSPPSEAPPAIDESNSALHFTPTSSKASCGCSTSTAILGRIRDAYRTACQIRLTSELLGRPYKTHPMRMNEEECPYEQAVMGTTNNSNEIFISSMVAFAKSAFPEFSQLSREMQWKMVLNFSFRFATFESAYRANKAFPHHEDRRFSGYTYWFTHEEEERFDSDCSIEMEVDQVQKSMIDRCKAEHAIFRSCMKRMNLSESEFLYATAIIFWTLDGLDLPDSVVSTAARCREAMMQELHAYYRDQCGMDEYAARLGELLTAIQTFDKTDMIRENIELLRLLDVYSDDSFDYQLQRDNLQ